MFQVLVAFHNNYIVGHSFLSLLALCKCLQCLQYCRVSTISATSRNVHIAVCDVIKCKRHHCRKRPETLHTLCDIAEDLTDIVWHHRHLQNGCTLTILQWYQTSKITDYSFPESFILLQEIFLCTQGRDHMEIHSIGYGYDVVDAGMQHMYFFNV